MTHDLAKELKDAGFPMEQYQAHPFMVDGNKQWFPCPDLSELIEACGEKFALHKNKDHWCAWQINSNPRERDAADSQERGSTPEEAVARLWLALNKK